jgi:hypothetical protein
MSDQKPEASTPDEPDKLTKEERDRIARWYAEKAPQGATCSICGTKNWAALDHFVTPLAVTGPERGAVVIGGILYPHFMLSCTNCGNVQFINALRAGVIPPKSEPEGK